jgi:phosphoribosylaminoimidazole-succinocarboxamide synthase
LPVPFFYRGKVRDTYQVGAYLLIVATDRLSAFDVVLPDGIPGKGRVLNQLSAFWFRQTEDIVPNHLVAPVDDVKRLRSYFPDKTDLDRLEVLNGRAMIVKKVQRIDVECVVRGYISGSAWEEYRKTGTVCGISLPKGLQESQELPEAIFTPTTKADAGHDEPITLQQMKKMVGDALAEEIKAKSIAVYQYAREHARRKGVIIADTKMEFGRDDGRLILIDELLTPDSSRFWDAGQYEPGKAQPSYDKQPVRDWLTASGWNKTPPAPNLPPDVIAATSRRYREAHEKLTGKKLG